MIAVLVHQIGEICGTLQVAPAGLLCDAELRCGRQILDLSSGSSWKTTTARGWKHDLPELASHWGFWEERDLRIDPLDWCQVDFDDQAWEEKALPGVENIVPPPGPEKCEGGVWYRRAFTVPDEWAGQRVTFNALSINYVADVWVNGEWVGYRWRWGEQQPGGDTGGRGTHGAV